MSVHVRCVAFGLLVFLYWMAAFGAAVVDQALVFENGLSPAAWWKPSWLVGPGRHVGGLGLDLLRFVFGGRNIFAPGAPLCWILLVAAATSIGTGGWLLAVIVTGWWRNRARKRDQAKARD